ncbi:2-methylcitrate dehydratase [Stutzerimonas stutzeri]|uniref:2-methylcitrate dehydratase n=1 Tax=Stutzerimonas stutzeri TaxID=316 RepID=W8R3I1_STUST|nr:MmgE/PrpD family protein [Stutzerimonas stutzeri]AHL77485.1 2-methylcitrate dehydratase [Stutzerimonas stutzeri]MCQ4330383.1 MmgE/PrpD family protein [Stutzerimonas stutzeri]
MNTSSDKPIAAALGAFAEQLRFEAIPEQVRQRAKLLILDATGIALASTRYEFAHRTLSAARELGEGVSDVIGYSAKLSLRDAILLNAVLVHGLDFDDTHGRGVIHATASCFPAALGIAAQHDASGRDFLTAYILGMEVATRLAAVAKGGFHQVGFHPTGLIGAFGCALIAGKLQGQTAEQLAMTQGIALSTASGSLEFLEDGAWTKRMHPGWAGVAGLTAATLARHGFSGPKAVYEGRFGLFKSHLGEREAECDYALATENLGSTWEVGEVAVKPVPACHFTHAVADSAVVLHEQGIRIEDIDRVTALVPKETVGIVCEPESRKRKPANSYEAQFSVPYAIASGLLRGRFGLADLEPDAFADPAALALMEKIEYQVDPQSGFPRHYSGEVVVTLRDGREIRHREAINRGAADRPLSADDIIAKYRENAHTAIAPQAAQRILDAVLNLDAGSTRELSRALAARA